MELRTEAHWRVLLEVETESRDGHLRRMLLDLPRSDFSLSDLHELAREGAGVLGILSEETVDISVRVSFPEDLEAHLLARLQDWYECVKVAIRPPSAPDGAPPS